MSDIECIYKWDGSQIDHGPVVTMNHKRYKYGTMFDDTQILILNCNCYTIFYNEVRKILGFAGFDCHYWGNLIFIPTNGYEVMKIHKNSNNVDIERMAELYSFRSLIGDGMGTKSFIFRLNDKYYDITLCTKKDTNKHDLSCRSISFIKNKTMESVIIDTIRSKYGKKISANDMIASINRQMTEIIKIISAKDIDIRFSLISSQDFIRNNLYDIFV